MKAYVGHLADFPHENVIYCLAVLLVVLLNTLLHTVHEGTCVRSSAVYSSLEQLSSAYSVSVLVLVYLDH